MCFDLSACLDHYREMSSSGSPKAFLRAAPSGLVSSLCQSSRVVVSASWGSSSTLRPARFAFASVELSNASLCHCISSNNSGASDFNASM